MTNGIVPIDQAMQNIPATMRQRMSQGLSANKAFSDGVRDSFPILSIRGKAFHVRMSGQEQVLLDPQTRTPLGSLDVVLVHGSHTLAKTYYIRGYTPGDLNPPDCWSMDSIRPDISVANKVAISCITCPMNMFGSARPRDGMTPEPGKRTGKACQDSRRIAVIMPHQLGAPEPLVMMLRVPQSSLKNLKNYAQQLERHGIDPTGAISRLQFDYAEAYPKLLFNFVNVLDEASYVRAVELRESTVVSSMLQAPDFDNAQSTAPVQNPQAGPIMQPLVQQTAPVMSSPYGGDTGEEVDEDGVVTPSLTMPPVQVAPVQAAPMQVGPDLIELPGGKWFSRSQNAFVEKAPEPVAAAPDPNVISLPNGQYYNMATKQYVEGPHGGATEAKPVAPQVTRKRAPATSRKAEPAKDQAKPEQEAKPAQQVEALQAGTSQAAPAETQQPEQVGNGGDAHPGAQVSATTKSLDDILRSVLPPTRPQ